MTDTTATAPDGGRCVLVTGASRGIGQEIAAAFCAAGDKVATITRSGRAAPGVLAVAGDVADSGDVDRAFDRIEAELGPVQVLVANAGVTRDGLAMRMSDAAFDEVLGVNLAGAFRCVRRASLGMLKARAGRIVLISSVVALHGSAGQANYAASKAGLIGLGRALAREYGGRGITTNVIAPGFIQTDMTEELSDAKRREYLAAIPAGRFGAPSDVAAAALFLASESARYINGAVLPVDGGLGMGH